MIREIKNNIYRITNHFSGGIHFVECETKRELFEYVIEHENKGYVISSVNLISYDGTTPRIAFRTDKEYKTLRKESNKR